MTTGFTRRMVLATLVMTAGLALSSCAAPMEHRAAGGATTLVPIRNARVPDEGVLSGGQPTQEQLRAAAEAGFRTVINLRAAEESGFEWEADLVESLGMRYVHIPVAGAEGLDRETVEKIDGVLREGQAAGPVLLHCASGNRIGAVLALRAAWIEGADPAQALDHGLANGLGGLEPATRKLLGLAPGDAAPPG